MVKTNCDIHGVRYSLKYKMTRSGEGELYKGILFLKDAFGFSYLIRNDKTTLIFILFVLLVLAAKNKM